MFLKTMIRILKKQMIVYHHATEYFLAHLRARFPSYNFLNPTFA